MTLPTSGTISFSQINAEFGRGYKLSSYRSVKWYKDDNSRGNFAGGGNNAPLDFSDFRGKRGSIPVTQVTNQAQSDGSSYVVPFYNTITIVVTAGQGGQAGAYGVNGCSGNTPTPSAGGAAGGSSSFGSYATSSGGGGGGGSGGGGAAGQSRTIVFNADNNTVTVDGSVRSGVAAPLKNTSILCSVGSGGAGGGGGTNFSLIKTGDSGFPYYTPIYACLPIGNAASGANGASGSILITVR